MEAIILTLAALIAYNFYKATRKDKPTYGKADLKRINRMRSKPKVEYDRRYWLADAAQNN